MFDDYNELAINRFLETAESKEEYLISDIIREEIKREKEEKFFDPVYLSQVRRDIASINKGEEKSTDVFKEKTIRRRLTFFHRILKILFGWKDFAGIIETIDEGMISVAEKGKKSVTLLDNLQYEQELINEQISLKKREQIKKISPEKKEFIPFSFTKEKLKIAKIFLKHKKKYFTSDYTLNIDIGSDSIKYSHIKKRNGELILESYGVRKLDLKPEEKQEIKNEKIINALNLLSLKNYYNISDTIVTISDISKKLKIDKFPKVAAKDLKNLILFNLKKDRNVELNEGVIFNYQILGTDIEKGVEKYVVLIVWTQLIQINNYLSILKECEIVPAKITFPIMGVLEYVRNFITDFSETTGIILDIGASNTEMIFYDRGLIKFMREFKIGSRDFTAALIGNYIISDKKIEIDFEKAEKIKHDFGMPPTNNLNPAFKGITYSQLHERMKPVLGKLFVEIKRTINYFQSNFRGVELQKILLSGGGSLMLHLDEYISNETGLEISRLSMFDKVKIGTNITDSLTLSKESYKLINSIGISLEDLNILNFLPENLKDVRKKALTVLTFLTFTFIVLTFISIFTLNILSINKEFDENLNEAKKIWNSANATQKEYVSLSNEKENKAKIRDEFVQKINSFSKRDDTHKVLKLISNFVPSSITLNILDYTENELGEPESIIIEGKVTDKSKNKDGELFNFYLKLEKSGYFSKVVVEENNDELDETSNLPDFVITCYL